GIQISRINRRIDTDRNKARIETSSNAARFLFVRHAKGFPAADGPFSRRNPLDASCKLRASYHPHVVQSFTRSPPCEFSLSNPLPALVLMTQLSRPSVC